MLTAYITGDRRTKARAGGLCAVYRHRGGLSGSLLPPGPAAEALGSAAAKHGGAEGAPPGFKKPGTTGIGRALLTHLKARHPLITLQVYQNNQRALAFYQREGFSPLDQDTEPETGQVYLTLVWRKP